ncbi:hypothetical protein ACQ4PT_050427 [Festuca glaucescens]
MVFPGSGSIPVTEESVQEVIGVPFGPIDVKFTRDPDASTFMNEQLGNAGRKQPTLTSLESKLVTMRPANSKFLRFFITYAMCSVLAPTTGIRINPRVKYLDSLQLQDLEVSPEGTRVSVWTNAMVTKVIKQDTQENGSFGAAPDKKRFTEAVEYAYHGFEASLQMLVKNLARNPSDPTTSSNNHSMPHKEILPSLNKKETPAVTKPKEGDHAGLTNAEVKDVKKLVPEVGTLHPRTTKAHVTKATPSNQIEETEHAVFHNVEVKDVKMLDSEVETLPPKRSKANVTIATPSKPIEETVQDDRNANATTPDALHPEVDGAVPLHGLENIQTAPPAATTEAKLEYQDSHHLKIKKEAPVTVDEKKCEKVVSPALIADTELDTITFPNADTVTTNTLKFTHIDGKKTQHIEALMREMKAKRDKPTGISIGEPGNKREEVTPETTCINFATMDYNEHQSSPRKADPKNEHVVHTAEICVDDSSCSEESGSILQEKRTKEFLKFVGTERYHEPNIPMLELLVFLDIGTSLPTRNVLQDLMKDIPTIEPSMDGLETVYDATLRPECQKILSEMEPKLIPRKRKAVTFADQKEKKMKGGETVAPSPSRYRTRSVMCQEVENSPMKGKGIKPQMDGTSAASAATSQGNVIDTGGSPSNSNSRRQTRAQAAIASMVNTTEIQGGSAGRNSKFQEENSAPRTLTTDVPSSAAQDTMNRKLVFNSTELDRRREAIRRAPDPPSFDLDTPPDDNEQGVETAMEQPTVTGTAPNKQVLVRGCNNPKSNPSSASITPVPHEYEKRISKQGQYAKSPFINPQSSRTFYVSKSVEELYSMVFQHGWKIAPKDPFNKEIVIDLDDIYVSLGDLAESVAPLHKMYHTVAEIGINIIKRENQNAKKYIMPMRITVCFPTLQPFEGAPKDSTGHYWLVNLNIKSQRYDCGFFTLKNLEAFPSRMPATFSQKYMPNIRKLYTDKWLRFTKKANWQLFA